MLDHRGVMSRDIATRLVCSERKFIVADGNANASANPTLVKHGTEIWSPEDVLYIRKENIVYWENLKASGKIVEAIGNYRSR